MTAQGTEFQVDAVTSAAIIDMGDITRDTTTGLDWLDLTITRGRSYNDISSKFGAGQEFDGWRYATDVEVQELWKNLGLTNGTWSSLSVDDTDYADFTAASELIGNTWNVWSSGTPDHDYDFGTTGITGTFYRPDRVIIAGMEHRVGGEYASGRSYKHSGGLSFKSDTTGSYLVAPSGVPGPNSNNEPTGALLILGTLTQGEILTADTSTLVDDDGLGVISYQWKAEGIDIAGATEDELVLTQDQVGKDISVVASYTDGFNNNEHVVSTVTSPVANVNDDPTGSVAISGTPSVGEILTASNTLSDPDGLGAISYQWQTDGIDIDGATSDELLLTQDHVGLLITVTASYTDAQGTAESKTSVPSSAVVDGSSSEQRIFNIVGLNTAGGSSTARLHFDANVPDGSAQLDFSYGQNGWEHSYNTSTYEWVNSELPWQELVDEILNRITIENNPVTTSDFLGLFKLFETINLDNSEVIGSVIISGTPVEGQTLTVSHTFSDADGLGEINYQWQADGVDIDGATDDELLLTQDHVGSTITAAASYVDGLGTQESGVSFATAVILNTNDDPSGSVVITGYPSEGETLTASNTLADEDGVGTISYQWQADGINIEGATGNELALTKDHVGSTITVSASYTDGHGAAESRTSPATTPVTNVNDDPTGSVSISGTATEEDTLTVTSTLDDEDGLGAISYQWQSNGIDINGATGTELMLTQELVGSTITVVASYTDGYGTAESVTSFASSPVENVNDSPSGVSEITGTASEGETLTVNTSSIADEDGLGELNYQWFRNGAAITGATADTYLLSQDDVSASIHVEVSYTDGGGTEESIPSSTSVGPVVERIRVEGTANDDLLSGSLGNDFIDGGAGVDTLLAQYLPSQYAYNNGKLSGDEGNDSLNEIEYIGFGYGMGNDAFKVDVRLEDLIDPDGQEGSEKSVVAELLDKISDLYIAYFGRAPGPQGLTYWFKENYTGSLTFEMTAKSFSDQVEFQSTYPEGSTNREFIESVYQNMFNRAPEEAGWDYWESELNGGMDKSVFLLAVINAVYSPTGGEDDRALLRNKHDVSMYYAEQTMLNPDEGFDDSINELLAAVTFENDSMDTAKGIIDHVFDDEITLTGLIEDQVLWDSFWG
jgi:hypothetical protein